MKCSHCGATNDSSASQCTTCGRGLSLSDEDLFKAILGPKNQAYYLQHFAQFEPLEQRGKSQVSWNWPAFLVTFYWLIYRRMGALAAGYFFLPWVIPVLLVLAVMVSGKDGDTLADLTGLLAVLFFVGLVFVPGLFANALYYRHCRKRIARAKASTDDVSRQLESLSKQGGTSKLAAALAVMLILVTGVGIVAAVAIPTYNDFVAKARLATVVHFGRDATRHISDYYETTGRLPSSLAEAKFDLPHPKAVQMIELNPSNHVLTLSLGEGQSLRFAPTLDTENRIDWKCSGSGLAPRHLPYICR